MKRLKQIPFLLCSALALFLIFSCSNDSSDSDSGSEKKTDSEQKVEIGEEYNAPSGKQVYRMVTKSGNFSTEKTEVWYYDEEDKLVYYSEIVESGSGSSSGSGVSGGSGTEVVSESISYTDAAKTKVYGKEKHSVSHEENTVVDLYEYYDAAGKITSAIFEAFDVESLVRTTCEYDPNKTEKNVFKYSVVMCSENGSDLEFSQYYAKSLTVNPSTREISGELLVEKNVVYQYDGITDISTSVPLCTSFITVLNDYDDTYSQSEEIKLQRTVCTLTEYRWNQDLYPEHPMEEISYNVEFDEDKGEYIPVKQSGYKVVQLADFEGQKKAIQEIWLTSDGETQYKYVYDYDIDNLYELDPDSYDQAGVKPLYMTKKEFYQNSSKGLFLAESSEYLKYNAGDNNEFCYQVEIHKIYDNL